MEKKPLVSVVIPAYNAERFIRRSLESALSQSYRNIEIIVVDDASTDKTARIIESYEDSRIKYFRQEPNKGQGPARNIGIRESTGQYITFLDADDYYLPEKVAREVEYLRKHPQCHVVYSNALHFYSDRPDRLFLGPRIPAMDFLTTLFRLSFPNINTLMVAREVLDKVGFFSEIRYFPEDWEMYLRIALAGYELGCVDEPLACVELREGSNTTMQIQHILKKNAIEVLENVSSQMTEEDRTHFQTDRLGRCMRFKLAIAYLADGQKRKFLKTLVGGYGYPLKGLAYPLALGVCLIPSHILVKTLAWLWRINQVRRYRGRRHDWSVVADCGVAVAAQTDGMGDMAVCRGARQSDHSDWRRAL